MSLDLAALWRAEGIRVRVIGNPAAHVRPGAFHPEGIIVHHTGDKGRGDSGLDILINGRDLGQPTELRGPLCNASPREDGQLAYISAGRANHAGAGSSLVLADVRRDIAPRGTAAALDLHDDTTGNGWFYGLEVDNSGGPNDDYPADQYDCVVRACAALCRHHDWTANRVILHREWTRRKVDWSLPGAPLRANVAARLHRAQLVRGVWTITTLPPATPPAVRPAPKPAPLPAPEVDMRALYRAPNTAPIWISDGITKRWVRTQAQLRRLINSKQVEEQVYELPLEDLNDIPTIGATP